MCQKLPEGCSVDYGIAEKGYHKKVLTK
jgi:hypothetical protein